MMNNHFTQRDYENAVRRLDIIHRPYLVYCHPDDKEQLTAAVGDSQVIESIRWIDKGNVIVIDRATLEKERICQNV